MVALFVVYVLLNHMNLNPLYPKRHSHTVCFYTFVRDFYSG